MPRKTLRAFAIIVTCLILIATLALLRPAQPSAAASASVSLSLTYGPPTSTVIVSGKGFKSREIVTLSFDTVQVGTTTASSTGSFSSSMTIPASALPGSHFVQARGKSSTRAAQTPFLARTNWAQGGFNQRHAGYNPYENVLSPTNVSQLGLHWKFQADSYLSSPDVVNGIAYVSSFRALYAINIFTGTLIWNYSYPANIYGWYTAPVVVNGVVYLGTVGTSNGALYALNASTGKLLWSHYLNSQVSPTTVANGIIYVSTSDYRFYALNASTGVILWSYQALEIAIQGSAVDKGIVYFTTLNADTAYTSGTLYALNATTGKYLWHNSIENISSATPSVANGIVYVGSGSVLDAFNSTTGTLLWSYLSDAMDTSVSVANGIAYFGSLSGKIYALNALSGTLLWTSTIGRAIFSSPAIANGVIYIGSDDNKLYALNAGDGTFLWSYMTGSSVESSPVVSDGVVYVESGDQNLYAFHLPGTTP